MTMKDQFKYKQATVHYTSILRTSILLTYNDSHLQAKSMDTLCCKLVRVLLQSSQHNASILSSKYPGFTQSKE